MRKLALTAGSLLLAAGLLACSSEDDAERSGGLTPVSPRPSTATSPAPSATTTTAAAPAADAPMPAVTKWIGSGTAADPGDFTAATRDGATTQLGDHVAFVTPSGRTRCMTSDISEGALACLVDLTNPPKRPADVYGEWVPGWVDFDGTEVTVGSVHADPAQFDVGTGAELPYGTSLRFGDYQCRSDPAGLFCVNFAHQTAVRLSDAGVQTFGCLREVAAPSDIGAKYACD